MAQDCFIAGLLLGTIDDTCLVSNLSFTDQRITSRNLQNLHETCVNTLYVNNAALNAMIRRFKQYLNQFDLTMSMPIFKNLLRVN